MIIIELPRLYYTYEKYSTEQVSGQCGKGENMKVLQISTVCGSGSVGRITVDIYHTLKSCGDEGLIAYGRRTAPGDVEAFRFGSDLSMGFHVLSTFFRGEHGFASAGQTRNLIEKIKEWDPDVIHLHNIHGFVLQVEVLFDYLKQAGKPVVWTLHDCWPYTGHCAFYDYTGCEQWKTGCQHCQEYRRTYPYALFCNHTAQNYIRKQTAFTGVKDLTIVTPSRWLKEQVEQSFLKSYPVEVIPNGVDQDVFHPVDGSALREQLGLKDKYVILGVANVWERRKGLPAFLKLAEMLPESMQIILIGLSQKQLKSLPANVMGLERTESAAKLAEYYSMADVFVNATLEDNFPTTNLEALSCGTPVITYETGGSPESLDETCGWIVQKGDIKALEETIRKAADCPKHTEDCLKRAAYYKKQDRFMDYVHLYHRLAGQGE